MATCLVTFAPAAKYSAIWAKKDQPVMVNEVAISTFQHIRYLLGILHIGTSHARAGKLLNIETVPFPQTYLPRKAVAAVITRDRSIARDFKKRRFIKR